MIRLMSYPPPTSATSATPRDENVTSRTPAVLLRLRIDGTDWAEHVPPVPQDHDVSVSFASGRSRARHSRSLGELGYRIVEINHAVDVAGGGSAGGGGNDGEFVDMVLRIGAVEKHPSWWRALAALAERAYPLALGPAARMWSPLVAQHQARAAERVAADRHDR